MELVTSSVPSSDPQVTPQMMTEAREGYEGYAFFRALTEREQDLLIFHDLTQPLRGDVVEECMDLCPGLFWHCVFCRC